MAGQFASPRPVDLANRCIRDRRYGRAQPSPDGDWGNWSYLQAAGATDFTLVLGPDGALHLLMVNGSPVRVNHAVRSTLASAFTWLSPVGSTFASVSAERKPGRPARAHLSDLRGGRRGVSIVGGTGWRPVAPAAAGARELLVEVDGVHIDEGLLNVAVELASLRGLYWRPCRSDREFGQGQKGPAAECL